jgi:hypothetical protein
MYIEISISIEILIHEVTHPSVYRLDIE